MALIAAKARTAQPPSERLGAALAVIRDALVTNLQAAKNTASSTSTTAPVVSLPQSLEVLPEPPPPLPVQALPTPGTPQSDASIAAQAWRSRLASQPAGSTHAAEPAGLSASSSSVVVIAGTPDEATVPASPGQPLPATAGPRGSAEVASTASPPDPPPMAIIPETPQKGMSTLRLGES